MPVVQNHGPGILLQQDSAVLMFPESVQNELQVRNIDTLPWPAIYPDLSPAEHVWDESETSTTTTIVQAVQDLCKTSVTTT